MIVKYRRYLMTKRYRVVLTTKDKIPVSKNFDTREECDEWILEQDDKYGVRIGWIKDFMEDRREFVDFTK